MSAVFVNSMCLICYSCFRVTNDIQILLFTMYWTSHTFGGPRRVNHAAVAIGTNIFTFGGYCSGLDYRHFMPIDIHILDTVKLKWLRLEQNDDNEYCRFVPFQRYGHTAVAHGSKIYLWGGRNDELVCNILFCFDSESLKWSTPKVYGSMPVSRDGHSACIIQNHMYIFGGYQENPSQFSQDLYVLDLHTMVWSIVETMGNPPSHRDFHTATVIDNKMYIFGGRGDERLTIRLTDHEFYCSDIYYLDTTTAMWVCPTVVGTKPPGRRSHSAFVHKGFLYIFGGFNKNMDLHFQDIHRYNPENSTWMTISPKGIPPCARRRQICQLVNDRVFISGGTSPIIPKPILPMRLRSNNGRQQIIRELRDHDDLHVLDLNPSLKDICLVNVWENMEEMETNIDDLFIPSSLKKDLAAVDPSEVMDTKT